MIVLGIDPGSRATGYGVIETGPVFRRRASGVIRTGKDESLPQRLALIFAGVAAVIAEHSPTTMAVEDLFNAKNARSSLVLGQARGVILLAGAQAGLEVAHYAPREVKLALTGNGAAVKDQVRFMVTRLLGLQESLALDESDALAVALTHGSRSGRRGKVGFG